MLIYPDRPKVSYGITVRRIHWLILVHLGAAQSLEKSGYYPVYMTYVGIYICYIDNMYDIYGC